LASTCPELLDCCLSGRAWTEDLLDRALAEEHGRAFLSVVVERLADLFEPRLCEVYAELFRQVVARVAPEWLPRTRRAASRPPPACLPAGAARVYVLSRITLGADVAVTSVLLDAAKRRYPAAEIVFVGPRKNYELFEADPRVRHQAAPYARSGSLRERLKASAQLWFDDGVVLDPDSRLTQLGMIQVCPEDRYCLFESRSFGGDSEARLPDLAAQWAGDGEAGPYVAPLPNDDRPAEITVSLGVGENPAKRLGDEFERELLRLVAATGRSVLADLGGSEEERARVERALQPGMRTHHGPFARFAVQIAKSRLFVGYDSAAGHVASACGVPLISIAAGFVSPRAQARWRPLGKVIGGNSAAVLRQLASLLSGPWPLTLRP
jgi:hypothetical protein